MPLIFIFLYLFVEVLVSYEIVDAIGVLGFVFEIIITAFIGFFIIVNFRIFFLEALSKLRYREISQEAFISSNIFRILGAILLILPGGFTDMLGILMQFSSIGIFMIKPFVRIKPTNHNASNNHNDVIDVDVISQDATKDRNG